MYFHFFISLKCLLFFCLGRGGSLNVKYFCLCDNALFTLYAKKTNVLSALLRSCETNGAKIEKTP